MHNLMGFLLQFLLFVFLAQGSMVMAKQSDSPMMLEQPVAYCLSALENCNLSQQRAVTAPVPSNLRELNGGENGPVTLVYALPPHYVNQIGTEILVQPWHRNHCFQFDNQRTTTTCTQRQLTSIPVPPQAQYLYTQNTESDEPTLFVPRMAIGNVHQLHDLSLKNRDPVLGLTGWYAFLTIAALFQMINQRNRFASLCIALVGIGMLCRTVILSNYSFAGLSLFGGTIDRRIEFVAIPLVAVCAVSFYGSLIGQRLLRARRVMQSIVLASGLYILLAQDPEHVLFSLQLTLILCIPMLVLGIGVVVIASKLLKLREKIVLWLGFSVMGMGMLADVSMSLIGLPFIAGIGLFPYCFAFETMCQYILVFFRNEAAHHEALNAQKQAQQAQNLAAQAQSEALLIKAQNEAQQAHNIALQVQAEMARKENEHAQKQLQQADKMASLGQLVASVTHEINTPIGAISSSGQSMTESLHEVMQQLPPLLQELDASTSNLLVTLLQQANQPRTPISSREERALVKSVTEQLEQAGLEHPRQKAQFLVSMNAHHATETFQALLVHPETERIQQAARTLNSAMQGANNVNAAVERVIKMVKALKSFSHFNIDEEKIEADLVEGIETVLTIYQGQTKVGVEVIRNYETIAPILCFPDELNQVWTNLIHNALQAMNHVGTLTIAVSRVGNDAQVSISDTGCGIPEEIRNKIFDVFFTTKPAGVGSGLGLDIVKKIIEKHQGRIELQSEVGIGTTFTVILPYTTKDIVT